MVENLNAPPSVGAEKRQAAIPSARSLLRWVYVGRLSVAIAVFVAASLYFASIPGVLVAVATATIASLVVTGASFIYTTFGDNRPGLTFLYLQAAFDLGLVTTVVHVTGGVESDFASLYILVIGVSAVLMPFTSSFLVTLLAAVLYVGDVVFAHSVQLSVALWMQISVFILVALATGYLASRVRVVGKVQDELEREVRRLRLEAGDILRQIGSGVITVDGDGVLVFANAAADRLFGRSTAEYIRKPFLETLKTLSPGLSQAIGTTQRERRRLLRFPGTIVT
ncbi:MAG: PAS domain-containing protein, partial [Gemmatimonadota bacterium]|nr:PAS domain-containing protein [Gemmatimonadota bacterium]